MLLKRIGFTVTPEFDGRPVGQILRGCGVSMTRVRSLKRVPGGITLDGQPVHTNQTAHMGQIVEISIPEDDRPAEPSDTITAAIVYQDEQIMILNKPPFMPVHPVRQYRTDTLANDFAALLLREGRSSAFRPLNRLDRNTSGLVAAAMNSFAAAKLSGKVQKEYAAVVHGRLTGTGSIDAPLRRREGYGISREVGEGGQPAVTHWETLACSDSHTLLRLWLDTGRTHQIRAHMSYLGYPLEGDTMYGGQNQTMARQALHCGRLWLEHPTSGQRIEVSAPVPEDMLAFLQSQGWPDPFEPEHSV